MNYISVNELADHDILTNKMREAQIPFVDIDRKSDIFPSLNDLSVLSSIGYDNAFMDKVVTIIEQENLNVTHRTEEQ